ncbi:MAG: co-chaperone GroES [Pseudonocardiales bacterium]|nr:co-chaperone GroES [Pseudonocardiales bacterium]MBV9028987.1 co-chaperone GroES [Pseudonocardiales bacterium]MBW0009984.1 co-chaperone GroES [Pseudonocardiales bacterium]
MLLDPRPGSLTGPSYVRSPRREASWSWAVPSAADGRTYPLRVSESKLEIQMLHDRVIVRLVGEGGERRSSGGILIPATAQVARRLCWGEVYGIGNHVRTVQVGDRVLFNPDDQSEVEVHGCAYLVVRERDLQAVASDRAEHGTGLYL